MSFISIFLKTNDIHFIYHIDEVLMLRTQYVKDLRVMLESKVYFHHHHNYTASRAHSFRNTFPSLDSLKTLCRFT
jgi:hypothetical protein